MKEEEEEREMIKEGVVWIEEDGRGGEEGGRGGCGQGGGGGEFSVRFTEELKSMCSCRSEGRRMVCTARVFGENRTYMGKGSTQYLSSPQEK